MSTKYQIDGSFDAGLEDTGDGDLGSIPTSEVACYVAEMIRGLRQLTGRLDRRDMQFLSYLLALAEDEASTLALHSYH